MEIFIMKILYDADYIKIISVFLKCKMQFLV